MGDPLNGNEWESAVPSRVVTGGGVRREVGMAPTGLPPHIRVLERVAAGGSSTVWRARDRRSGRDVAVKVVDLLGRGHPSGDLDGAEAGRGASAEVERRERFEAEIRALARLAGHPNVLEMHAAGVGDGHGWIVTPLAEGSLADAVRRRGPLDVAALVGLAVDVSAGLAAAHEMEVVHGDLTPANVVLLEGRAVLADFGLGVVQSGDGSDRTGATPGWAAPERLDGSAPTTSSDVYGLGATLWTAATGRRPPVHRPPSTDPVPRGVDAIVVSCTALDATRRPGAVEVWRRAEAERRRRRRYCAEP